MSTDIPHSVEARSPERPATTESKLPKFLSFSIIALVVLTGLTIVALFVDSIENKGSRIFLTFLVFAAFIGLTALDTLRTTDRQWYPPAALLSNGIFLGASLLSVWLTNGGYLFIASAVVQVAIYALILRGGLYIGFLAMNAVDRPSGRTIEGPERNSSVAASWLVNIAAVLYVVYLSATLIIGSRASSVDLTDFWDVYLKISTAVLILAGLALSISLLLRWFFGADERKLRKDEARASIPVHPLVQPPVPRPLHQQEAQPLLPWPTFSDGTPLPATAQGQPDFEAAARASSTPPAQ